MGRKFEREEARAWAAHLVGVAFVLGWVFLAWRLPWLPRLVATVVVLSLWAIGWVGVIAPSLFSRVVVESEGLRLRTWWGRRWLAWRDVELVRRAWPGDVIEIHTARGCVRIALEGRVDAAALLAAIAGRVPVGAYQVAAVEERLLLRSAPKRRDTHDPVGAPSYRTSPRAGRVVATASLRPEVPILSWLLSGPAFALVVLMRGWRTARELRHHANAAVYWRRVETVFGAHVRLTADGFESLCRRWAYRETERGAEWLERDAAGELAVVHRLREGDPIPPSTRHEVYLGLPAWLGGAPLLRHVPPLESAPLTAPPHAAPGAPFFAAPAAGDANVVSVDWDTGPIRSLDELGERTREVTPPPWESAGEDGADEAIAALEATLDELDAA